MSDAPVSRTTCSTSARSSAANASGPRCRCGELAELAEVSNPYLSQIERGLRKPSAEILQQVANALRISVETLYVRAGILPDESRWPSTVPEAIEADPHAHRPSRSWRCATCTRASSQAADTPALRATRPVDEPLTGNADQVSSVSNPDASRRRDLAPHVAAAAARFGRQRRHERVRPRDGVVARRRPASSAPPTRAPTARASRTRCSSSRTTASSTSRPGPHHLPKEALPDIIDEFTDRVLDHIAATGGADVVHANYWLSGVVAHQIKHALDIPFVSTFHTLARVKAEGGDPEPGWRDRTEAELINCADAVCVSCVEEEQQFRRLYGEPQGSDRDHRPGRRARVLRARRALGGPRRARPRRPTSR